MKRLAAILLACAAGASLMGCAGGPRGNYGFGESGPATSVTIPSDGTARVALAGVWQDDLWEPGKRQRHIRSAGDGLATVMRSLGKGLAVNPALQVAALGAQPIPLDCPALEKDGQLSPNAKPCELPARIDAGPWREQMRQGGASHAVLVLAITEKTVQRKETTWGLGPGAPVFTTETPTSHWFRVQARVYDLATGEMLTEASAIDGATGAYGVMMVIFPYYMAPDQSQFLDVMSEAVGKELAGRFQAQ